MNVNESWKRFITAKYRAWKGDEEGQHVSAAQYATYLGIKQQYVNKWLLVGKPPKNPKIIQKLVKLYGYEVFYALGFLPEGMEIPAEEEKEFTRRWFDEENSPRLDD